MTDTEAVGSIWAWRPYGTCGDGWKPNPDDEGYELFYLVHGRDNPVAALRVGAAPDPGTNWDIVAGKGPGWVWITANGHTVLVLRGAGHLVMLTPTVDDLRELVGVTPPPLAFSGGTLRFSAIPEKGSSQREPERTAPALLYACATWGKARRANQAAVVVIGERKGPFGIGKTINSRLVWLDIETPPPDVLAHPSPEQQKPDLHEALRHGRAIGFVGIGLGHEGGTEYTRYLAELFASEESSFTKHCLQQVLGSMGMEKSAKLRWKEATS